MERVQAMMIACLMPTYGRRRAVVANSIELFLRQTHPDKQLVGMEDGAAEPCRQGHPPLWCLTSCAARFGSLPTKYDVMWSPRTADAYAVWDDDDVYLPWHLESHHSVLERHGWSKPSHVWSTYGGDLHIEQADGRFHGSIAIRTELLERVGGWRGVMPEGEWGRADFDQRMLWALSRIEPPGDPCEIAEPSYVFRWGDAGSQHCQGLMRSPDDESWYGRMKPGESLAGIEPALDQSAASIISRLA